MSKFDEKELPTIDNFYSKLNSSGISKEHYAHAKNVWQFFKIKDLGDYHDVYIQADVSQLSDVVENFRSLCLKDYELDPSYFVSTPGLAFEAMLKCTKVKLELLTDIDMVLMIQKDIRGGLTQVVKRHAAVNHKYLPSYGSSKKSVFLQYLDANNFYGYAMSQKLSLNGYEWDNIEKLTCDFVENYDVNGDMGYLLEVDVEYPKELLGAHAYLPFLPERRYSMHKCHNKKEYENIEFKEYEDKRNKDIAKADEKVYKALNITHEPENKLIATVQDKNKYVCHISTLQMALNHGLRLQKLYRAIKFNQSDWLKPYIDKNTELRKVAKNDFKKNFFKLMNNAVFGKMIQNVRKRREIKLVVTEQRRKKLVSEPNYQYCTAFSDHSLAIEMRKTRIYKDKPIMVGQAILDKSKELMYHFYYDYLKPKYKKNVKLMYMDTDSFVLEIEACDFFEDITNDLKQMV